MVSNAHMIITNWGEDMAWSVSSPQIPGIVAAFDNQPKSADLMEVARAAGLSEDGSIDVSVQTAYDIEGRQFYVRCRNDFRFDARSETAVRAAEHLAEDSELRSFLPKDQFSETTIVAVLGSDTLRSVISNAEAGQPLTIAVDRAGVDGMMYGTLVHRGEAGRSLSDLGLSHDSTAAELFRVLDVQTERHPERELIAV